MSDIADQQEINRLNDEIERLRNNNDIMLEEIKDLRAALESALGHLDDPTDPVTNAGDMRRAAIVIRKALEGGNE